MNHHVTRITLAALLAAVSLTTVAADNGFYTYGSVGVTDSKRKSETDTAITNAGVTAFTSSAKERDTGYKLQGGYRFNKFVAVEGGYANLGKFTYDAVATVPVSTRHGDLKADGWNVSVVGSAPVSNTFAFIGRLGVLVSQAKYHCDGTGIACVDPDRSKRDTALNYGVGADWNFTGSWFARAEYEVFRDVGSRFNATGTTGTTQADIKMGSIGLGYRF